MRKLLVVFITLLITVIAFGGCSAHQTSENVENTEIKKNTLRRFNVVWTQTCIVSFFKTFKTSYTYTPIGHIDNAKDYEEALSAGSVAITFSI